METDACMATVALHQVGTRTYRRPLPTSRSLGFRRSGTDILASVFTALPGEAPYANSREHDDDDDAPPPFRQLDTPTEAAAIAGSAAAGSKGKGKGKGKAKEPTTLPCVGAEPTELAADVSSAAAAAPNEKVVVLELVVPAGVVNDIFGRGGEKAAQLSSQLCVDISLLRSSDSSKEIRVAVKGPEQLAAKAWSHLREQVSRFSEKLPFTHFISLPLTDPALARRVLDFHRAVRELTNKPKGFDESILVAFERLHLTVLMLRLHTSESLQKAIQLLKSCSAELYDILETRTAVVNVGPLATMEQDVRNAHVIYAEIAEADGRSRLRNLCNSVIEKFVAAGLASAQDTSRPLKLHATLINTKYRIDPGDDLPLQTQGSRAPRIAVDAEPILAIPGWGKGIPVRIGAVHLSRRGDFDKSGPRAGYYTSECIASLP